MNLKHIHTEPLWSNLRTTDEFATIGIHNNINNNVIILIISSYAIIPWHQGTACTRYPRMHALVTKRAFPPECPVQGTHGTGYPGAQVSQKYEFSRLPRYPWNWYRDPGTPRYLASDHFNTSRGQECPMVTGTRVPGYHKKNKCTGT
jgi:hypothetical protein